MTKRDVGDRSGGFAASPAMSRRRSGRRSCGWFRRELVTRELDRALFEAVTVQLRAKAVTVKTGTLIDATVIGSASQGDAEAGWSGHRSRKAIHGYKAHPGVPRAERRRRPPRVPCRLL